MNTNTHISTPRSISFTQSQTAMQAQTLIGAVNAEIGNVASADENPQVDKATNKPGEVFIQTDQVEVALTYQPGTANSPAFPKKFISNAKDDIKAPNGQVITPKGTNSAFDLNEDGTQVYRMETPTPEGSYRQQAIVDPKQEVITFQDWIIKA